jgi:hypothetical protein
VKNKLTTRAMMLIATFLFAIPLMPVNAASPATLSISPATIGTDIGGTFTANVILSGGSNVIGYDVRVTVNPDVLTVTGASLAGSLLDPATNNVLIARQQVFPSIGFVRFALVVLGPGGHTPSPSASLLSVSFQVNDPSAAGSIATATEYPSSIDVTADVVGAGFMATSTSYMPPGDVGLRSVGCRAANNGFNTNAKGFTDPLFCRVINLGSQSITARGDFNFASLGGVTGSLSGPTMTLAPGQAAEVNSALTVAPHTNDIFLVTGQGTRVITFQDGSVLAIPGVSNPAAGLPGSVVFQVTVTSPF